MGLSHGLPCSLQLQKVSIMGFNEHSNENVCAYPSFRERKGEVLEQERERERDGRRGLCSVVFKEEQVRGNLKHIIEVDLIRVVGLWFWLWLCHPLKQEMKKVHKFCNNVTVEKEISY